VASRSPLQRICFTIAEGRRQFADHMTVIGAKLDNGMLHVDPAAFS
jgi:hypothetical protein